MNITDNSLCHHFQAKKGVCYMLHSHIVGSQKRFSILFSNIPKWPDIFKCFIVLCFLRLY